MDEFDRVEYERLPLRSSVSSDNQHPRLWVSGLSTAGIFAMIWHPMDFATLVSLKLHNYP
jgi:hypothetical protein